MDPMDTPHGAPKFLVDRDADTVPIVIGPEPSQRELDVAYHAGYAAGSLGEAHDESRTILKAAAACDLHPSAFDSWCEGFEAGVESRRWT
jgi:hypothetical protein